MIIFGDPKGYLLTFGTVSYDALRLISNHSYALEMIYGGHNHSYNLSIIAWKPAVIAITTKAEDKITEEEHIRGALSKCGYPNWAVERVKKQRAQPKEKPDKKDKSTTRSLGNIMLPYVAGLYESFARLLKKYNIQSQMKPFNTIRQHVVHPKDKRTLQEKAGVVYNIPCKQCPGRYIGETGRKLGVRIKEHHDNVEKAAKSKRNYTRAQRKEADNNYPSSAITQHTTRENHVIDWDSTTIVGRENVRIRRQILETMRIRQEGNTALNRDGGNYPLPHLWGPMLVDVGSASHPSKQKAVASTTHRPSDHSV